MTINRANTNRKDNTLTTAIIRQQRSSCVAVVHRYDHEDLVNLVNANAISDKTLASNAQKSAGKNVNTKAPLVIRQDIIKCTITNNKAGNGGNFTLTLKRGKELKAGSNTTQNVDYLKSIQTGDWIMLYMKKSGEITDSDIASTTVSSGFKFLGIIENVRMLELDDPGRGTPRLEIVITGRSFAKVFDTNIFFNPIVNQQAMQQVLGADFIKDSSKSVKPLQGNTADQVCKRIIDFYLKGSGANRSFANQNWFIPRSVAQIFRGIEKHKAVGMSFIDILDTSRIGLQHWQKGVLNGKPSTLPGVAFIKAMPSSGSIWSILQFMQNSAVNEIYCELINVGGRLKPSLVLRQMPFSNKELHETNTFRAHSKHTKSVFSDGLGSSEKTYFVELPKHKIISSDIKQKNIGKSDHERINYVIVVPKIDADNLDVLYIAGSNPASVQRYGLKIFQAQTSYVLSTTSAKEGLKKFCGRVVVLIEDWFFLAHNLYNGTIVTDGVDRFVEVGQNLYIQDIKQLYHVEGYTHTYNVQDNSHITYETEFRVSRGQFYDESTNLAAFIASNNVNRESTTVVTSFIQRSKEK